LEISQKKIIIIIIIIKIHNSFKILSKFLGNGREKKSFLFGNLPIMEIFLLWKSPPNQIDFQKKKKKKKKKKMRTFCSSFSLTSTSSCSPSAPTLGGNCATLFFCTVDIPMGEADPQKKKRRRRKKEGGKESKSLKHKSLHFHVSVHPFTPSASLLLLLLWALIFIFHGALLVS